MTVSGPNSTSVSSLAHSATFPWMRTCVVASPRTHCGTVSISITGNETWLLEAMSPMQHFPATGPVLPGAKSEGLAGLTERAPIAHAASTVAAQINEPHRAGDV